jgi:hypothetical protein
MLAVIALALGGAVDALADDLQPDARQMADETTSEST